MSEPTPSRPSISVFFPAYNDGGTIGSMVLSALIALEKVSDDYEVIVGDDASQDHTPQVIDELEAGYPGKVKVIHHARNRGYGGNLRSGFAAATKDWIFYTDGDAQYDASELTLLVERIGPEVGLVNGWKIERNDPLHRKVVGRIYQHVIRLLFHLRLRDVDCDFRLIRRSLFDEFELHSRTGAICVELMRKIQSTDCRMVEVPVHHYHRVYGRSQFFNVTRIVRTLVTVAKLWWELMPSRVAKKSARRVMPNRASAKH